MALTPAETRAPSRQLASNLRAGWTRSTHNRCGTASRTTRASQRIRPAGALRPLCSAYATGLPAERPRPESADADARP
ncbi:hypothetical protein GCM10012287_52580 [Streptomyces daqingensis]|uniref:Uncharacterized protein n=1 Tax=Streptomyces daqingensis TaxID=1472640 RepID=A0ABQ2MSE1_9ACTN|nr:hypothetical protein GCM10012287_52580 [Streptomyces daqingensis]